MQTRTMNLLGRLVVCKVNVCSRVSRASKKSYYQALHEEEEAGGEADLARQQEEDADLPLHQDVQPADLDDDTVQPGKISCNYVGP